MTERDPAVAPPWWERCWRRDRLALAVVAVGSLLATLLWRGVTRPMADTSNYRTAARLLREGWPSLPARTPGFPALLLLTGSSNSSTHVLFFVQLVMHAVCVLLVVDVARSVGVGRWGRALCAALLMAPAVMLRVVYEGTECLTALGVTVVFWLLVAPRRGTRAWPRLVALGVVCGATALVRPTFALLFVPVGVVVALQERRAGRRLALRPAVVAALPAVVIVGALSIYNGARFDSFGMTPLFPYHLNSKTSEYVENLPSSYEPARSVLIEHRDRALLRGESMAPRNYIWEAHDDLERVTGKHGRELDRYVMQIDIELITHNPFGYVDAVVDALVNYSFIDSQPAILGLGRPAAWTQQFLHFLLLGSFLAALATVPGLALAGRVPRRQLAVVGVGMLLAGYTAIVSAMVETGTARLRAPSEPILACVFVIALSIAHGAVAARRSRR